ncbi:MAG: FAD-dependent oxidoreductase [Maritimibacter sp.]
MSHIAVIGAGQAGAALCAKLRNSGYDGRITLVGAESVPPYQRPPLSKKYMSGEMELERLFLRPERFYAEQNIDLRTGTRVAAIDPDSKQLRFADGESLSWDKLALTTGADPIRLPAAIGGNLAGVYVMRSLADADAMAAEFVAGRRLLVVGGGYIGLEAAAVAASKGLKVVLIEKAPRILARVAAPETANWIRTLHQSHGVEIREQVGLERLEGEAGRVTRAWLDDGTAIEIDFVIAGIGVRPATDLAEAAGIATDNGILVNAFGETSQPGIYAAGDCASFPYQGGRLRLESVPNAIDHAEATAATMLGQGQPYLPKPWFWSDQYDVKRDGTVSHWYFSGERLISVDAMNDPRAYMVGKRMIENGQSPDKAAVANPDIPLKDLMQ